MEKNNQQIGFEVKPLDINIVKMQFNLIKRLEKDFASVCETFYSKNPKINLGTLEIICNLPNEGSKMVKAVCTDKTHSKKMEFELFKGEQEEILNYIKSRRFFEDVKISTKNFIVANKTTQSDL